MSIAVYAGTFDPLTLGHMSIIRQAARVFSHVRILIAVNPDKTPMFTIKDRITACEVVVRKMPQVTIDSTEGFVIDYARDIGANYLIRGVRNATDASFETELANQNRSRAPEIVTVLFPAEPAFADISSSFVRSKIRNNEPIFEYCPQGTVDYLNNISAKV